MNAHADVHADLGLWLANARIHALRSEADAERRFSRQGRVRAALGAIRRAFTTPAPIEPPMLPRLSDYPYRS